MSMNTRSSASVQAAQEDAFESLMQDSQSQSLALPISPSPNSFAPFSLENDNFDPEMSDFFDMLGDDRALRDQLHPRMSSSCFADNLCDNLDDPLANLPPLLHLSAPSSPLSSASNARLAVRSTLFQAIPDQLSSQPAPEFDISSNQTPNSTHESDKYIVLENMSNSESGEGSDRDETLPNISDISTESSASDQSSPNVMPDRCTCGAKELRARLQAASQENSNLRKRVAALSKENRDLRTALATTQSQLQAQIQAAQAHVQAQVAHLHAFSQFPQTVARHIAAACSLGSSTGSSTHQNLCNTTSCGDSSVQSVGSKRRAPKRKRTDVATMACLLLLCGAFFVVPDVRNSNNASASAPALVDRTPSSNGLLAHRHLHGPLSVYVPSSNVQRDSRGRYISKRNAAALPAIGDDSSKDSSLLEESALSSSTPKLVPGEATGVVRASHSMYTASERLSDHSDHQYVLCKDGEAASQSVRNCVNTMRRGNRCDMPNHLISLILPASSIGLDDRIHASPYDKSDIADDNSEEAFAEVHCKVISVAPIPKPVASAEGYRRLFYRDTHDLPYFGRVISAVTEATRS